MIKAHSDAAVVAWLCTLNGCLPAPTFHVDIYMCSIGIHSDSPQSNPIQSIYTSLPSSAQQQQQQGNDSASQLHSVSTIVQCYIPGQR